MNRRSDNRTPLEKLNDSLFYSPCGCWLWFGGVSDSGYGVININRKSISTHRLSYEIHKGEITDGLLVLHTCDVKCCVNPDHLYLGTWKDNARDMVNRNRLVVPRGENSHWSKLKEYQVLEIRSLYSYRNASSLARKFNVTPEAITRIIKREVWKHI